MILQSSADVYTTEIADRIARCTARIGQRSHTSTELATNGELASATLRILTLGVHDKEVANWPSEGWDFRDSFMK